MTFLRWIIFSASLALVVVPQVFGDARLYFTGQNFINGGSDPTVISQNGLKGIISSLLSLEPVEYVDTLASQQVRFVSSAWRVVPSQEARASYLLLSECRWSRSSSLTSSHALRLSSLCKQWLLQVSAWNDLVSV